MCPRLNHLHLLPCSPQLNPRLSRLQILLCSLQRSLPSNPLLSLLLPRQANQALNRLHSRATYLLHSLRAHPPYNLRHVLLRFHPHSQAVSPPVNRLSSPLCNRRLSLRLCRAHSHLACHRCSLPCSPRRNHPLVLLPNRVCFLAHNPRRYLPDNLHRSPLPSLRYSPRLSHHLLHLVNRLPNRLRFRRCSRAAFHLANRLVNRQGNQAVNRQVPLPCNLRFNPLLNRQHNRVLYLRLSLPPSPLPSPPRSPRRNPPHSRQGSHR